MIIALLVIMLFPAVQAADKSGGKTGTLTVALYKYVPRLDQFKTVIKEAWKKIEPGVTLRFTDWDCYSADPPEDLDVFVFDAIYLSYFREKGFLSAIQPGEVKNPDDFLVYALEGAKVEGTLYGIPQLGCASILFYRHGDRQLADAGTLGEVAEAIGECTYTTLTPPAGTGLMVDISGGTTSACYYLEAVEDIYNKYTDTPPLPPDTGRIDSWAMGNVQKLLRMASVKQAKYYNENNAYQRGTWFGRGLGRAMIGFTEAMSAMGEEALKTIAFKPMPLSDKTGVSLFYSDIIGINASVTEPGKRRLALKLANLMASSAVIVKCFGPGSESDTPQYLMPVRRSVFHALGKRFPIYNKMYRMVIESQPHLFRIGPQSKTWLKALKGDIKDLIFKGACAQQENRP
jgi:thiamine pyridinylase